MDRYADGRTAESIMRSRSTMTALMLTVVFAATSWGHFQVLRPVNSIVDRPGKIGIDLIFTHPMEQGPVMSMAPPVQCGVLHDGRKRDLKDSLKKQAVTGKATFGLTCDIRHPGDHIFYIEPAPYWEPTEGKMIVHYTKTVVNAMGLEQGWDAMVGFPVEIEPLVRPYGLWTGNIFRGVVKRDGRAVPFAEIEVEYLNDGGKVAIPAPAFVTQVIKADANGTFSYAMPRSGWWGFAALIDGEEKMKNPDGNMVPVELGALIWIHVVDMK